MKTIKTILITLLITLVLFACSKDDDAPKNSIIGTWEIVDADFLKFEKYMYFNSDNSYTVLAETPDGFKRKFTSEYLVTENTVSVNDFFEGDAVFNLTFTGDQLVLVFEGTDSKITLKRLNNAPEAATWVKNIEVLNEHEDIWNKKSDVDIAFSYDKTKLVSLEDNNFSQNIIFIDPISFEVSDKLSTRWISAVEIEKYDNPNRYRFESRNSELKIFQGRRTDGELSHTIDGRISGLASVNNSQLWIADRDKKLYLFDYTKFDPIVKTITLGIYPMGLDYQNGFLYIVSGAHLYKCQTSPNFKVLESYQINSRTGIDGVAFDGANFWLRGRDYEENRNTYKFIKTNLTL